MLLLGKSAAPKMLAAKGSIARAMDRKKDAAAPRANVGDFSADEFL